MIWKYQKYIKYKVQTKKQKIDMVLNKLHRISYYNTLYRDI